MKNQKKDETISEVGYEDLEDMELEQITGGNNRRSRRNRRAKGFALGFVWAGFSTFGVAGAPLARLTGVTTDNFLG